MGILRRFLVAALAVSGCAQTLKFEDCNTNEDCAAMTSDGGKLYCTSDHLCVIGLPDEQLCPEVLGTPAPGSLVIAALTDRSSMGGKPLDSDHQIENAIRLAVTEINMRQAGASQPPIVAYLCDTASDPAQSLKAAKRAVLAKNAVALIGPTTSDGVVAVNSFIKDNGVLVISPSATAVDITNLADNGLVWRTAASDALQSKVLAARIKTAVAMAMGQPKVDSMHVTTVYGTGLDTAFSLAYSGTGFHKSFPYTSPSEIPKALNDLNADMPTHLLIVADTDCPAIVAMIKDQPFLASTTQFYMTDAARAPQLFGPMGMTVAPAILGRIHGTSPAIPKGPTFMTFQTSFIGKFTTDPATTSFVANAYDATYLIAITAAATVGHVPNGKDLATGLMRLKTSGPTVPVGPTNYLDALKQMSMGGVHLEGASGLLEFDASGDPLNGTYDYWCVDTTGAAPAFTNICP